jgi:TPR repeat protein
MIAPVSILPAQSVKSGIEAWQRSDYVGAVNVWRPLAEKGDADAQFNLAQSYRLGRGVKTNLSAAKTWFERAARQGHVDAQTTLGLLLFQNGDQAQGVKWLKPAAEKGEARAQLVYGTALVNGDGVTQDPALGYAMVRRAAAQGLPAAKETLAQLDSLVPAADRKKGAALAQASRAPAPKPAAPITKKPAAPTARVTTLPAASGAWRIQLGAFSQKISAETLYQKLAGRASLAGRRPFYIPAGAVTRLQVGPFESKTAAQAACVALAVPCFPVPAR